MRLKTLLSTLATAVLITAASMSASAQSVKAVINTPQPTQGIAANPVTNLIYVVEPSFGGPQDTLDVISGATDTVVKKITIPTGAYLPAINLLTNTIYVASCNTYVEPISCFVTVVNGKTAAVVKQIPVTTTDGNGLLGIAVNPVTDKVYVANASDNVIDIIDGRTNKITGTLGVTGGDPTGITINPFLSRLYSPLGTDSVDIFDICKNTLRTTTTVGNADSFAAVNWVTGNTYVTDTENGPSTVGVLDKNGVVITTVPVGDAPYGLDVDPLTNRVFVASTALNNITVIDGKTNTVAATVPNVQATFVSVNFGTQKVYVSGNSGVTVLTEK